MTAVDLGIDLLGEPIMRRGALFHGSDCRLTVTRDWARGPRVCFIGHNPSIGDARRDDPTICWWTAWCRHWGFGGFTAVNLYPFCTPDPAACRKRSRWHETDDWAARDALLFVNLPVLIEEAKAADQLVACWGAIALDHEWIEHVVEEIQSGFAPYPDVFCLGKTGSGAPKHPMARGAHRIPRDQSPILWRAAA